MKQKFVPDNFNVPEILETNKFRLRMLTVDDVDKDYNAIMSSIEHLRKTPTPPICGDWPPHNLSKKKDFEDLKWHEEKHTNREIFTYTVMNLDESKCFGCVYLFPTEKINYDVEIYFWVTKEEFDKGLDTELFNTIKDWIKKEWSFKKITFPGRKVDGSF